MSVVQQAHCFFFFNYFSELYFGRLNYVNVAFFRGKHSLKNSVLLRYSRVFLSRQSSKKQRYIPGNLNLQQHSTDLIFPKYHTYFDSVNQQRITFFTDPQVTRYRYLTFISPCMANIFAEYNQQGVTFHNLFISVRRSTCFRRVFRPSSGAQNS